MTRTVTIKRQKGKDAFIKTHVSSTTNTQNSIDAANLMRLNNGRNRRRCTCVNNAITEACRKILQGKRYDIRDEENQTDTHCFIS